MAVSELTSSVSRVDLGDRVGADTPMPDTHAGARTEALRSSLAVSLPCSFCDGGVLSLLIGWGLPANGQSCRAAVTVLLMRAGPRSSVGARWLPVVVLRRAAEVIYSSQVELLPEETYYWNYSRHLESGLSRSSTMVAWLIHAGATLFGETEFGIRTVAISAALSPPCTLSADTRSFDDDSALVALVLMQLCPSFFSGLNDTPDVPLTAAWPRCSITWSRRSSGAVPPHGGGPAVLASVCFRNTPFSCSPPWRSFS